MLPEMCSATARSSGWPSFSGHYARHLRAIAPHHRDNPRVVLLTPGPYNETYFEHAFLARYLGYTLVEGGDLTVRDNRVFLKLLGGLQPVDVILRRLDDDFCDPLELRRDSFLGVPGLVQAVRPGTSPWPTRWAAASSRSPALLAYLPALCRSSLGEDAEDAVGPDLVVRRPRRLRACSGEPAADGDQDQPSPSRARAGLRRGAESRPAPRAWPDRSGHRPGDYVGQEQLRLSTAPVLRRTAR